MNDRERFQAVARDLCRFMTLLHEETGNPEGEFPRVRV